VESLKRKLVKDADSHKTDNNRIMNENVTLIREINELRREIKNIRSGSQLKADKDGISGGESARADDAQKEIEMQRTEMQRLRQRIDDLERQLHARGRPVSREKLPPMEGFEPPQSSSFSNLLSASGSARILTQQQQQQSAAAPLPPHPPVVLSDF
jgi:polyhydroxyalkanoate synthesis regulator phasin